MRHTIALLMHLYLDSRNHSCFESSGDVLKEILITRKIDPQNLQKLHHNKIMTFTSKVEID